MTHPEFGLGAAAVRAWLQKRREAGLPGTALWLSEQVCVTASSVHEWLTAGWIEGGSIPRSLARKRIAAIMEDPGVERLFDQDDARRDAAKRGKPLSDRPVAP